MSINVESLAAGIHPRSENLVRVTRDYDRGRTNETALNESFAMDIEDLVKVQVNSGFSFVCDGQLRWQDFIRPFSESVSGLENGADLSRWFDTNTFYKKPTVTNRLSTDGTFLGKSRYSNWVSRDKTKRAIALPGPFTLTNLVDDQYYQSRDELVHDFSKVLKEVIQRLASTGDTTIQINEPSLVYRYGDSAIKDPKALEIFLSAFKEHLSNLNANIILHTYFGDCSTILKDLVSLPGASTIGIDFTQTSLENISAIEFDGKRLGCGCVDARSSLIESSEWISSFCSEAYSKLKPSGIVILPSSDLKYLPRTYSDRKLISMGDASKLLLTRISN